jgi:ABC-type glycerol-3-phosphate transport system substrate-binding protein
MTRPASLVLLLSALLAACGGSMAAPPPEEVTETWTAGDDAPLEEAP